MATTQPNTEAAAAAATPHHAFQSLLSRVCTMDLFPTTTTTTTTTAAAAGEVDCPPQTVGMAGEEPPPPPPPPPHATQPFVERELHSASEKRRRARAAYLHRFLRASCQEGLEGGRSRREVARASTTPSDETSARIRGCFAQVVKETAFCFMAQQGQQEVCRSLALAAAADSAGSGKAVAGTATTSSVLAAARRSRQEALVGYTTRLLLAAVQAEQSTQEAIQALRSELRASPRCKGTSATRATPPDGSAAAAVAAVALQIPSVPLPRWTGWAHYAAFMRVSAPKAGGVGATANGRGRATQSTVEMRCYAAPAAKDGMRHFQRPEDLAREMAGYWKLHEEAAARARLRALRAKDTEAFAEHVSMLKVSTLLGIMEKTHDFMMRIGLRLKHKAEDGCHSTEQEHALSGNHPLPLAEEALSLSRSDRSAGMPCSLTEYQRFKAYVSSTKDDFRLVHQVDAFVERQPSGLRATLLPHQLDGLRFLMSLHVNGINGILADEMGVGKTIQTLAFLLHLKEQQQLPSMLPATERQRPHLVLAPLSVVREWREACEHFVPHSMRVVAFHELTDPVAEAAQYDIVLMPIHSARTPSVQTTASRVPWGYLVVDEAHKAVANLQTQTAQAILSFPYQRRLVLSGTPLNSDLQELWSLLFFLNPEVFTDGDSFDEVFRRPFATYEAAEMELSSEERGLLVLRLHQILRPFMLRRCKKDIDETLRITFHTFHCPLAAVQKELLHLLRTQRRTPTTMTTATSDTESDSEDESGDEEEEASLTGAGATQKGAVALANARSYRLTAADVSESTAQLLCNHAFLLPFFSRVLAQHHLRETVANGKEEEKDGDGAADTVLASSGKFLFLHLFLSRLVLAKRKAVIFTHWLDCVDLLREYMVGRGWGSVVEVLTGSTSEEERQASVTRFRDDPGCLFFILSVKAGGCGINLQSAHVVMMLDRDYTTTNEDQALARVYRIGQVHTVRAVYLTTDDPAEARVATRAEKKNKPRLAIIEDGNYQLGGGAALEEGGGVRGSDADELSRATDASFEVSEGGGATESGMAEGADRTPSIAAESGQMMALWQSMAEISLSPSNVDNDDEDAFFLASITEDQWATLCSLVRSLDELVLTESDGPESPVRALLSANLPSPAASISEGEGRGDAREQAAQWEGFWLLLREALRGPRLLQQALAAAVENDRKLRDPEEQRRRRERRRHRSGKRLRQMVTDPPPDAWFMQCWEQGIEDDEEIAALYESHKQERKLEAERKCQARAEREERKKRRLQETKETREAGVAAKRATTRRRRRQVKGCNEELTSALSAVVAAEGAGAGEDVPEVGGGTCADAGAPPLLLAPESSGGEGHAILRDPSQLPPGETQREDADDGGQRLSTAPSPPPYATEAALPTASQSGSAADLPAAEGSSRHAPKLRREATRELS